MDIDVKNALRPFAGRLRLEAAIKSISTGGLAVLPVWLALALMHRVLGVGGAALAYMPAAWLLAAALLYILRYRPTLQAVARRVDAAGLEDRAKTMVEFARSDGVLFTLQREDAARRLAALSPRDVRIAFNVPAAAVCLCLLCMIGAVGRIPDSVIDALPFARQAQSEEEILLREKIAGMRAQVEGSELEQGDKAQLLDQLAAMEQQLDAGRMDISALQDIQRMMEEMSETVAELTPRDTYAAVLLEYERLRPLGEAIFGGNMDIVVLVIDNLSHTLLSLEGTAQVDALMNLVYDVNATLAKPIRDKSQENLRQAMMMLAGGLESAAEMVYGRRDNTAMIETAFDTLKVYISEFLGVPLEEERYDPWDNKWWEDPDAPRQISSAMLRPAEQAAVLSPMETEHVYDPPQALGMSSYVPGEMGDNGVIQRIAAPQDESKDGTVPYGTVFGAYYARYLQESADGAIPQELMETVEAYFNGI